jgi:hypothetical protein
MEPFMAKLQVRIAVNAGEQMFDAFENRCLEIPFGNAWANQERRKTTGAIESSQAPRPRAMLKAQEGLSHE